jgi:hypothetical protein
MYLGNVDYAHNLWLDVSLDAGILPFIFLGIFHATHFLSIIYFLKSCENEYVKMICICIFNSFLLSFIAEPALQGSYIFFSISCFFFGFVRRLTLRNRANEN